MKETELVYYGDCHHIFSDDIQSKDCIHRYFEVTPLRGKQKRIIVCNEYLRLKVRENAFKWKDSFRGYRPYEYTVEDIVNEFITVSDFVFYNKQEQNRINPTFHFCICPRPYITSKITLFNAVELLIETQEKFCISDFNDHFIRQSYSQIYEVARYLSQYNKYKKQKERIDKLLKHLNYHNYDTENPQRMIELFIIFFEIQTYIESCKK